MIDEKEVQRRIDAAVKEAVLKEREACIKVFEDLAPLGIDWLKHTIRSRGVCE